MANLSLISGLEKMCLNNTDVEDFITSEQHPVTWFENHKVQRDYIYEDVLFANKDMKISTLEEYNQNKSEYSKWKLFGYNMVICYEYTYKGETDKALEVIRDVEHIVKSIGSDDSFLNSIKVALNHITFSFKGHLLKLCSLETPVLLESYVMPNEMDQVNKAALYGAKTLFFYGYGLLCAHIAKDSALKAISLNECEAEWHYLRAKVFTGWQQTCGNFYLITELEIDAAKKAVELSKNDEYKLHLAHVYQRMSRHYEKRKLLADAGIKLVKEVLMNNTSNLLVLKNCLLHLVKLSFGKPNDETNDMIEKLVDQLKSSDNSHVQAAIGNYYMSKKDYKNANCYFKKSYEVKSFGYSLEYVCTFYKIDPNTTQIVPLLVEMLKTFSHPFTQEMILSQIISYSIVIKNDLIQALEYIPQLLDLKHVTCVRSVQNHRMKFSESKKPINLINMLTEKLNGSLMDYTLPADYTERVSEVLQMLESYKQFVSCLMQENKHIFGNSNLKKNVTANYNKSFSPKNNNKEFWCYKNPRQNSVSVNNKEEGNWRLLKPDSMKNPNIFSRNHHKH